MTITVTISGEEDGFPDTMLVRVVACGPISNKTAATILRNAIITVKSVEPQIVQPHTLEPYPDVPIEKQN